MQIYGHKSCRKSFQHCVATRAYDGSYNIQGTHSAQELYIKSYSLKLIECGHFSWKASSRSLEREDLYTHKYIFRMNARVDIFMYMSKEFLGIRGQDIQMF